MYDTKLSVDLLIQHHITFTTKKVSYFSLSSKRSEVICPEMTKKRHPTVFDAQLLRNPLEYLHEPYTA